MSGYYFILANFAGLYAHYLTLSCRQMPALILSHGEKRQLHRQKLQRAILRAHNARFYWLTGIFFIGEIFYRARHLGCTIVYN